MLKKIRIILEIVFFTGITIMLLDFTGALHAWLGWMVKLQLLPAIMAVNVAVLAGLFVITLLFGRIYCSTVCPLGAYQDGVSHIAVSARRRRGNRKPFAFKKEKKILRYTVLVLTIAAFIAGLQYVVAILAPYSAWGRIVRNLFQPVYILLNNIFAGWAERAGSYAFYPKEILAVSAVSLIVAVLTLILVTFLSAARGRAYCNSVCPVGSLLSLVSRASMFRPVIDGEKCKSCRMCEHNCKSSCIDITNKKIDYSRCVDCFDCIGQCKFDAIHYRFAWKPRKKAASEGTDAGRRAFLTGSALVVGSTVLNAQGRKKVDGGFASLTPKIPPERETPLTPPGSRSVKDFYSRCTACQLCIAECPNGVLRPSSDLSRLMQPEMSYENGYCRPECTRCSELCPAGAITKITREEKTEYHIGTARVKRDLCVAEDGTRCGNCARHCPVGAIMMVPIDPDDEGSNLHPVVAEELCIGCGACENLCPSRPISAITVEGKEVHV